jgi:hypothetical protein
MAYDLLRLIQIFIGQGGVLVWFLILAWRTLKDNRSSKRVMFGMFYVGICGAFVLNFIYALLTIVPVVQILFTITYFMLWISSMFLTNFVLMLYFGEDTFHPKYRIMLIIGFIIALCCVFLVADPITVGEITKWKPVSSVTFSLYIIAINLIFNIVPTIFFSLKQLPKFPSNIVRKKWRYFIAGYILLAVTSIGTMINTAMPSTALWWAIINAVGLISGSYLMYVGVGKKF